jgi:hypothetical protein
MSHFLVIFDRRRRADAEVQQIEDAQEAMERLFEIERELRGDSDRGVVLLVADDEQTIRATHAHYFRSFDELVDAAAAL